MLSLKEEATPIASIASLRPVVQHQVIDPMLITQEMRQKMCDERASLMSKRSVYKNKGLRMLEMNSSRKVFPGKGPIKPSNLEILITPGMTSRMPVKQAKAMRPQTAPHQRGIPR
jgi:hypothetical protein